MKRLFLLSFVLMLLLITFSGLAVTAGQALGRQSEAFALENCRLPCWNGIQPGKTPYDEALTILDKSGYTVHDPIAGSAIANQVSYDGPAQADVCHLGLSRTLQTVWIVSELTLTFCGTSSLGNIMRMLGQPETIMPHVSMVTYKSGQIVVFLRARSCQTALSPHDRIQYISLTAPQFNSINRVTQSDVAAGSKGAAVRLPWEGFIPAWRYHQLFPGRTLC